MAKAKGKKKRREEYAKELRLDDMLPVRLSKQSRGYLERISRLGICGRTAEEAAERFIDERLQNFVEVEDIVLKP